MRWILRSDPDVNSVYHRFSETDRALIDRRLLAQQSVDHRFGDVLPTVEISERLRVTLQSLKNPYEHSLDQGDMGRRIAQRGETLCKVTGASRGSEIRIFDATGGLCREAQLMSTCGAQVWSVERCLPLYLISQEALSRAKSNVQLFHGEAVDLFLPEINPHTVYLDPMFPESKKSAAVGKEAMILRAFAPQVYSSEERDLLAWAMDTAYSRVVVKRPAKAPHLGGVKPTASVRGRAIRFDLYGKRKLP